MTTGSTSLPPRPNGAVGMVKPNIEVACKCGHIADTYLEHHSQSNRLKCSKCGSKGWDLVIRYINNEFKGIEQSTVKADGHFVRCNISFC